MQGTAAAQKQKYAAYYRALRQHARLEQKWHSEEDQKRYPKCWYEPLSAQEDARMGLRFTLSHPVTAAVPSGEEELFRLALSLSDRLQPLGKSEINTIKQKAFKADPLFRFNG